MAEELVAWVDADEKLLKVIPLRLANSDPRYLHREIAGLIVDNQRRVLLQQRALTKKVKPGLWTVTVAGHVTYGHTLEQTFHQELTEEMGIDVKNPVYLFRELVSQSNETHFCHWYLGKYEGGDITIQPEEVAAYAWVSQPEFADFAVSHAIDSRTEKMLQRYWSGEWDQLL